MDADDFFWTQNAALAFPQMAENVDVELNKYKEEAEGIMKANGVQDMSELE